jgi:hypothetical protein
MTVLEKYNMAIDSVDGDDSLYVDYVSDIESHVPVLVDLLLEWGNVVSLLGGVIKKRINLYYFNGELVSNISVLGILLREAVVNRESCLTMLDDVLLYCHPALRFEVKVSSNDVDSFVSIMKSLKNLRYSVDQGVIVEVPVIEEPVVEEVVVEDVVEDVVVQSEEIEFSSDVDFVSKKKK